MTVVRRRGRVVDAAVFIGWLATTAGIAGEMIRDLMVASVERRFAAHRAPHPVQCLTDNGTPSAAVRTVELATALNLEPCFTPVENPESNGMAQAFVKTFKRDYVRVNLFRTRSPPSAPSSAGWTTTTTSIRTVSSPTDHQGIHQSPIATSRPGTSTGSAGNIAR